MIFGAVLFYHGTLYHGKKCTMVKSTVHCTMVREGMVLRIPIPASAPGSRCLCPRFCFYYDIHDTSALNISACGQIHSQTHRVLPLDPVAEADSAAYKSTGQ